MTGFRDKTGAIPHYHDHRERLRERFHEIGGENLRDYELLELILFQAIPRVDTKPIAKALLQKFGSFGEVLAAPLARLTEVDGVGEKAAHHIKVVYAAAQRFLKEPVKQRAAPRFMGVGHRLLPRRDGLRDASSSSASSSSTSETR